MPAKGQAGTPRNGRGSAVAGKAAGTGGSPGAGGSSTEVWGAGVTSAAITIGLSVLAGGSTNTALTAAGASEAAVGDGQAAADAVVKYLNGHGGIAGRQIKPVYRQWDTGQDWRSEYARDCATFTQDNKVFAVVSQVDQPGWDGLASCLAKRQTPFLHNSRLLIDRRMFGQLAPYIYETSTVGAARWGGLVDAWVDAGFFDKGAKVGVVLWDDGISKRVLSETVAPRLRKYGLTVDQTAAVTPYYSTSEIGGTASQYQNAVLQFASAGVTHVLFLGTWSTGPFFFLQSAENQHYRPRYGLNSTELPNFIVQSVPAAQLHRAVDIGFWPTTDVPASRDPNDNAAQALCLKIISDAGIDSPSRFASMEYARTCDGLFLLRDALAQTTNLTSGGLRAAVDQLGVRYRSPLTFSTRFGPQRYDGVGSVRIADFDDTAGFFGYRHAPSRQLTG
jgi:ABC-type branched-subunit amino acid transport system substrate-binding protein